MPIKITVLPEMMTKEEKTFLVRIKNKMLLQTINML